MSNLTLHSETTLNLSSTSSNFTHCIVSCSGYVPHKR